ncbi:glycosyltransferase WbuB, partial [bacterium]|nr:glycosyltransferase WbuB [bacterium]
IPKWMGARVIIDLHDLMPEFYQAKFQQNSQKLLSRLVYLQERLSCRFADRVITVTEHWRQTLIKRGVNPEKCGVVMNLADSRVFHPITVEERSLKDPSQFCLFYHGDMPQRYGLDLVLRAMDQVLDQIPNIQFKLVGGGQYLDELKRITKELNLEKHVEFIGGQPVEKLPSLIATADVAVVPYRNDIFTDSLMPTKLMEYAVEGIPTIVARTTAISAYFTDEMVEYFAPGDVDDLARCILRLYRDPQRCQDLGDKIRRFNDRFNWDIESAKYVSIVERLCTQKGNLSAADLGK